MGILLAYVLHRTVDNSNGELEVVKENGNTADKSRYVQTKRSFILPAGVAVMLAAVFGNTILAYDLVNLVGPYSGKHLAAGNKDQNLKECI